MAPVHAAVEPKRRKPLRPKPQGRRLSAATGRPEDLLALQRTIGNAAVSRLVVQRYTTVDPADYTLGVGSSFASQSTLVAGGTARYVRDEIEQTAGGVADTHEESQGQGVWSKPVNKALLGSALPRVRYGTDGTDAIAIEDTAAEPKLFYATPAVVPASNAKLAEVGAAPRLIDEGGSMVAPADPTNPGGATLTLHMVKPGLTPNNAPAQVLERVGMVSECNAFVKDIVGQLSERVAVFGAGAGTEAEVAEEKEPTQAIANFASTGVGNGGALANHLTTTDAYKGEHDNPLPNAYQTMVGKGARDQSLGINAGAKAGVGEGYVITRNGPMPDKVTVRAWLDALDKKVANLPMTAAELDMFKHKWGYHYAGIVAQVGDDAISLENYNRNTPMQWNLDDFYINKIHQVAALRRHLEVLANQGSTVPSIPQERNKWLTQLRSDLTDLGAQASVDEAASLVALNQVNSAVEGMRVDYTKLWHFKIYGTAAGQSFHEQWENSLDDPMTLRIRQSNTLARQKLRDAKAGLQALGPGRAASRKLLNLEAGGLAELNAAVGSNAIGQALDEVRTRLLSATATAMHDWAAEAAALVGKNDSAVPNPGAISDDSGLVAYGQRLTPLIDKWRAKGWAVRSGTKQRLTARKASIGTLRNKATAAAALKIRR